MKNILVIYHANCTDGFGAAYAAWKKFGSTADYLPMAFGDPLPAFHKDLELYILDFSFPKEIYRQITQKVKNIVLLDHHKHAFANLKEEHGCFFNLSKSGARLAWEYFHPQMPVPRFITYIEDGDLLKFSLEETKPFYRGILPIPYEFEFWEPLEDEAYLSNIIEQGKLFEIFFQSQVKQMLHNAKPVMLCGKQGLMINSTYMFVNEVGQLLAKQCGTFALVWFEEKNHIKCSLRSVNDFDVSEIAMKLNGGGHPQASAFTMNNLNDFVELIKKENLCFTN